MSAPYIIYSPLLFCSFSYFFFENSKKLYIQFVFKLQFKEESYVTFELILTKKRGHEKTNYIILIQNKIISPLPRSKS